MTRSSTEAGDLMNHDVIAAIIAAGFFGTVAVMAVIGWRQPRYAPTPSEGER